MRSAGVTNITGILPILQASLTRRVDWAGAGDSNYGQIYSTGYPAGMVLGLAEAFGCWGTGLLWGNNALGGSSSIVASGRGAPFYTGAYYVNASTISESLYGTPPAEFQAMQAALSAIANAATNSARAFGGPQWLGAFTSNYDYGHLSVSSQHPMDLNGKIGFSVVIWRPETEGTTKLSPQIVSATGGSRVLGRLATETTSAPTRSSHGFDEVLTVWDRGDIIDLTNATNPANNATYYDGSGFSCMAHTYSGSDLLLDSKGSAAAVTATTGSPVSVAHTAHGFSTGDWVYIRAMDAALNGTRQIVVTDEDNYTIGVNATVTDGTGTAEPCRVVGIVGCRMTDEECFRGFAFTTLYYYGGQPTKTMAIDLVGIDETDPAILNRGAWSGSSVSYAQWDKVTNGGVTYVCYSAHVSAAGTEPGVGATWYQRWMTLGGQTDEAVAAWIYGLTLAQRASNGRRLPPMLIVQIQEGGNDAGNTSYPLESADGSYRSLRVNGGTTTGATDGTGWAMHCLAITRRIRYVWENVCGFPGSNLGFVFGCYHPQPPSYNSGAQWSFVRQGMPLGFEIIKASEPRSCFVDGYKLANYAEFGIMNGSTGAFVTRQKYKPRRGIGKTSVSGIAAWADATAYAVGDLVTSSGTTYVCKIAHTSSGSINLTNFIVEHDTTEAFSAWYRGSGDQAHLTEDGYIEWGRRCVMAIRDAAAQSGLYTLGGRLGRVSGRGIG